MAGSSTVLFFLMDDGTVEYIPIECAIKEGFSYGKIKDVDGVISL